MGKQLTTKIFVAEVVKQKLSAADHAKELSVVGTDWMQRAVGAPISAEAFAYRIQYFVAGQYFSDNGKCLQVALICVVTELSTSFDICNASAHGNPGHAALAFTGRWSPNFPATWIIDGGFDPQYAALLVVHFDRILLDPVFNSGAFHPGFQIGSDLSFEPRIDAPLQKSQDVLWH